jgi:hypothetical protein
VQIYIYIIIYIITYIYIYYIYIYLRYTKMQPPPQVLLQSYAVTHLVLCGRPDKDDHVSHAQLALQGGSTELHLAPLVPEDPTRLGSQAEDGRVEAKMRCFTCKNVGIEWDL